MKRLTISQILLVGIGQMGFGIAKFLQDYNLNFDVYDKSKNNEQKCLKSFSNSNIGNLKNLYDIVLLSLSFNDLKDFILNNHNKLFSSDKKVFLTITRPNYLNLQEYQAFNDF